MMTETIAKKKRYLPEFRDLFIALFKIPDRDVHTRVLDAVNGIISDSPKICTKCQMRSSKNAETQTELNLMKPPLVKFRILKNEKIKLDPVQLKSSNVNNTETESEDTNDKTVERKYFSSRYINHNSQKVEETNKSRRRARKIPHVEKSSNDIEKPMGLKRKLSHSESEKREDVSTKTPGLELPLLSENLGDLNDIDLSDISNDEFALFTKPNEFVHQYLRELMRREFLVALEYDEDGFLPLHSAIIEKDLCRVKRLLYINNFRHKNLNEMVTQSNETPLHLAIRKNSTADIVKELLENGATIDETDLKGNTLLHLTILYENDESVLNLLLHKNTIDNLKITNDDGLSCLHFAVTCNQFRSVKNILDHINNKLGIESFDHGKSDPVELEKMYKLELKKMAERKPTKLNPKKSALLNQKCLKQGYTPLLYALQKESKLIIFMLLAHLSNPHTKDQGGRDCITYATEYPPSADILEALRNVSKYILKCI